MENLNHNYETLENNEKVSIAVTTSKLMEIIERLKGERSTEEGEFVGGKLMSKDSRVLTIDTRELGNTEKQEMKVFLVEFTEKGFEQVRTKFDDYFQELFTKINKNCSEKEKIKNLLFVDTNSRKTSFAVKIFQESNMLAMGYYQPKKDKDCDKALRTVLSDTYSEKEWESLRELDKERDALQRAVELQQRGQAKQEKKEEVPAKEFEETKSFF